MYTRASNLSVASKATRLPATFVYDGDDRRISTTNTSGVTTKYIFDGGNVIQETDGAGALIANYNVEPQELMGNIVSRKDTGGANSFYQYSALSNDAGNVTSLTDSNQATIATYNYEAFGNIISQTGVTTNAYKFSTKNLDDESGLYYFGARYYDSEIGRFITKDPVPGNLENPQNLNPYVYALNNPINLIDPTGEISVLGVGGTIAMGAGIGMMFLTSPAWAPTAGVVLVVGGGVATITDYYLSLKQAREIGKQLAIQHLKRKIERHEGTFTPQELQKMGIIPSNKQLKKNGLTSKDIRKLGLTGKKKSDKKK